jgi:hypothetical protein
MPHRASRYLLLGSRMGDLGLSEAVSGEPGKLLWNLPCMHDAPHVRSPFNLDFSGSCQHVRPCYAMTMQLPRHGLAVYVSQSQAKCKQHLQCTCGAVRLKIAVLVLYECIRIRTLSVASCGLVFELSFDFQGNDQNLGTSVICQRP